LILIPDCYGYETQRIKNIHENCNISKHLSFISVVVWLPSAAIASISSNCDVFTALLCSNICIKSITGITEQ
jgi:hypothetical protein